MEAFKRMQKYRKWCLPQVEANHNHSSGIRIGEAKKPGQSGNGQSSDNNLDRNHGQHHGLELLG
eukprot:2718485-Heterocapsa_arctica.AAC.1